MKATSTSRTASPDLAYSYLRFSDGEQGKGDSIRRQTELRDSWIKKTGVVLDTSLAMTDRGVSAHRGKHRTDDRHCLTQFLKLVEAGRIAKGSFLIVESLDRLSREDIIPALSLVLNLITSGVRIVQLLPVEMVYHDKSNPMEVMLAIMELSRGNSESKMKVERVSRAWQEKRAKAAERPLTSCGPAWLRLVDGEWQEIPARAEAVRNIFRMCREGFGLKSIAKHLNATNVPPMGKGKLWVKSYVAKILKNRAAIGEFQAMSEQTGSRLPEGDPISGYFPAVISEEDFYAAMAGTSSRLRRQGREFQGGINLFAGLLRNARDGGGTFHVGRRCPSQPRFLYPYRATNVGKGAGHSFAYDIFERGILTALREVDPREVIEDKRGSVEDTLTLSGELAEIEGKIAKATAQLVANPDIEALVDVLRSLEGQRRTVCDRLTEARQRSASPLGEAWGSYRSLISVAESSDENRIRLRTILRRVIDAIWVMVVPVGRKRDRVAACQVHFAGGNRRRHYLLFYSPATCRRSARSSTKSFASVGADTSGLDLSRSDHARRLERVLLRLDPSSL